MANKIKKIERCGYCGRYFRGTEYLTTEELKKTDKKILDNCPTGYGPDAENEYHEQNQEEEQRFVTRDMAIDAGDTSLEGQPYN